MFVAFRQDAIVASFGEDGLDSLLKALEKSSDAPATASDGPIAMVIRVASLGEFADKDREAFRKAAADAFPGEGPKRDRVALDLKGEGDGIRLRLAIDVPALKLMVLAGGLRQN